MSQAKSILILFVLFFATSLAAQSATLTVCASGCAYSSIQGALAAASDGDTLELAAETFFEGDLMVDRDLTIRCASGFATVDGNGALTVFEIDSDAYVTFENLRLTDATRAVITNHGTARLETVYVLGSGADSTYGGIVNYADAFLQVLDASVVAGHRSPTLGGGINNFGDLEIDNSTILGNRGRLGGGILNSQGDVVVTASSISGNRATLRGGGYANVNVHGGAVIVLPSASFSSNIADVDCDRYYDIHRTPACVN
ncbi:MAG: hypothetical protein AAF604_17300 [Acidobacteriota bacterium]